MVHVNFHFFFLLVLYVYSSFLELIYSVDIADEEPHFVRYSAINHHHHRHHHHHHYYCYYYYYYYYLQVYIKLT